jgi:hypothetical protein
MRAASNLVRSGTNDHDADPGLHLQSSVGGSRPAAGTAGRKWLDTDTLLIKYDTAFSWDDIPYLRSTGGTVTGGVTVSAGGITVTGSSTITGTLGGLTGLTVASGGITVTGNSTITGTLGGLTGLTVASGGLTVTGNSTITGTLGGLTGLTMASGTLSAVDLTTSNPFAPSGLTCAGNLTFTGERTLVPGTTSLVVRNVGSTADAIKVEAAQVSLGGGAGMTGNVIVGAEGIATTATTGLVMAPTMSGKPTGAVRDGALMVDETNVKLHVRVGGGWVERGLT